MTQPVPLQAGHAETVVTLIEGKADPRIRGRELHLHLTLTLALTLILHQTLTLTLTLTYTRS